MITALWRLLATVSIIAIAACEAAYFTNGGRGTWLAGASFVLGILLFLAAIDLGLISIEARTFGHMLHLRCKRYPELRAHCGYELDYVQLTSRYHSWPEQIFAVANQHPSGRIYAAEPKARHHHVIALMHEYGDGQDNGKSEQGFLTTHGRWVDRKEAMLIARAQGQLQRATGAEDTLFSEDLWEGPLLTRLRIEDKAYELVNDAIHNNQVVRIETRPLADQSLAMGRHEMVVDVREALAVTRWKAEQAARAQEAA